MNESIVVCSFFLIESPKKRIDLLYIFFLLVGMDLKLFSPFFFHPDFFFKLDWSFFFAIWYFEWKKKYLTKKIDQAPQKMLINLNILWVFMDIWILYHITEALEYYVVYLHHPFIDFSWMFIRHIYVALRNAHRRLSQ